MIFSSFLFFFFGVIGSKRELVLLECLVFYGNANPSFTSRDSMSLGMDMTSTQWDSFIRVPLPKMSRRPAGVQ